MNQQDMMIAQQMLSTSKSTDGVYAFVMVFLVVIAAAAAPIVLVVKIARAIFRKEKLAVVKRNPYESLRHTGSLGVYSRYTAVTYSLPKPPKFDGLPMSRYN